MKTILPILAAILAFTQSLHAQAIQTVSFANIGSGANRQQDSPVAAGQVFKLINWLPSFNGPAGFQVDGITVNVSPGATPALSVFPTDLVIAGPRTVSLIIPAAQSLVCSYVLQANESVGTIVPSTSVVIPADAAGPVQIILESSTDLITWTAATPGSYGSSTAKRFFRVRAVAQ